MFRSVVLRVMPSRTVPDSPPRGTKNQTALARTDTQGPAPPRRALAYSALFVYFFVVVENLSLRVLGKLALATSISLISTSCVKQKKSTQIPAGAEKITREYGWAMPVCAWSEDAAYCFKVAHLVAFFPYRAEAISGEVRVLVSKGWKPGEYREGVAERAGFTAVSLCGENGWTITLGRFSPPEAGEGADPCTPADRAAPVLSDSIFGLGSRRATLAAWDDAYDAYLEDCLEETRGGGGHGGGGQPDPSDNGTGCDSSSSNCAPDDSLPGTSPEERAKENLDEKKKEADTAQQALQVAQDAYGDAFDQNSDATASDRSKAYVELVSAAGAAERANKELTVAQEAYDVFVEADAANQELIEKAQAIYQETERLYNKTFGPFVEFGENVGKILRPKEFGQPKQPRDCLGTDCGAMTCEEEARIMAMRDYFAQFEHDECNDDATPIPGGSDECFGSGSSKGKPVNQATKEEIARIACEERKKYAGTAEDYPCRDFAQGENFSFDPCIGPLVMCAPGGEADPFASPISLPLEDGTFWQP